MTVPTRDRSQHPIGVGGRMAALVCALVAAVTAAGGAWTYLRLRDGLLREEFSRQSAAAVSAGVHLTSGVDVLRRDVRFLASAPAVGGIIRARGAGGLDPVGRISERQWQRRLSELFEGLMGNAPHYLQIRLIGVEHEGREIVRVWRVGDRPAVIPDERLEGRRGRPYFEETILLPPGAVYLSDPVRNRSPGRAVPGGIPTVWAATTVYDRSGAVFGVLVIDTDMRPRFARVQRSLGGRYEHYLFDEQGNFFVHPKPSPVAEKHWGEIYRVREDPPALWQLVASKEPVHRIVDDPDSATRVVATLLALHFDPDRPERYYGLLLTANYQNVVAQSVQVRNETILSGGLLLLAVLGLVLTASRKVTRPLRQMTAAVQAFGDGDADIELPVQARDEAGVLARAFEEMILRVRRHAAALEREIGERRRAEEALRVSEGRLRFALAAARAIAWEWDPTTDKISWDEPTEDTDTSKGQPRRRMSDSWLELVHPDDAQRIPEAKRRALEENEPYAVECRVRGVAGEWRHWVVRGDLVREAGGQASKLAGICWDATEVKRAQEQVRKYAAELERKNREMEQFVYSVSHDLKSPLVTCKGFVGIVREDLEDGRTKEALQAVDRVERATLHMGRLIEDLLQLSRVGRVTNKPETISVSALVAEIADDLRRAGRPDVDIDVQPDMPRIVADPMAVGRLFQNLLSNAFRYGCSEADPRIAVGARIEGGEVRFFVRDNGPGIPAEYQERVFGLFQRLDAQHEGTGIGLAIVSKIMEVHGGRAWVESTRGEGATFWVGFPRRVLAPEPETEQAAMMLQPETSHQRRIK